MTFFEIPLVNRPQNFEIDLAGITYSITNKWNDAPGGGWLLDIFDAKSGAPILCGLPLVTGANLLEDYDYLNFGGGLYVFSTGDIAPTFENLGTDAKLYFGVQE